MRLIPTSIKFTAQEKAYLKRAALKARHGRVSLVVRHLVQEAMRHA